MFVICVCVCVCVLAAPHVKVFVACWNACHSTLVFRNTRDEFLLLWVFDGSEWTGGCGSIPVKMYMYVCM